MKKEELNSERIPYRDQARQIHAANQAGAWYTAKEYVTVITTTPRHFGPWALPRVFNIKRWVSTQRKIFSLNPPDDTIIMVDDGTIALRNPKSGEYVSFDFRTSNSDDFDIVRRALRKWPGITPSVPPSEE